MLTHRILSILSKSQKSLVRPSLTFKPKIAPLPQTTSKIKIITATTVFCRQPHEIAGKAKRQFTTTPQSKGLDRKITDDEAIAALDANDFLKVDEYLKTNKINKIVTFYGTFHATLLHFACYRANTDAMKYLFDKGAAVNSNDADDEAKPLHYVLISGQSTSSKEAAINLLLAQKANINDTDKFGRTALDAAIMKFYANTSDDVINNLKLLTTRRADPNIKNQNGKTSIFNAIDRKKNGSLPPFEPKICEFLISAGAKCKTSIKIDKTNYNAPDYALYLLKYDCYQMLVTKCKDLGTTYRDSEKMILPVTDHLEKEAKKFLQSTISKRPG